MNSSRKSALCITMIMTVILLGGWCETAECVTFSISPVKKIITAYDGYPLITYRLKLTPDFFQGIPPKSIVFYIQDTSYESSLSKIGVLAGSVAAGSSVIMLESRGVGEDKKIDLDTCYKYSERETRVKDHLKVIDEYLKKAPPNVPVVLMGGNDGGNIAISVAKREPRVTHLILLSSGGGWAQAEEMEFLLSKTGEFADAADPDELHRVFDDIKAHPDSLNLWHGRPYRGWSSYLWVRPIDELATLDIPIFLAQGKRDENIPVESARAVKNKFDELGKTNLIYKEYDFNSPFAFLQGGLLMSPLIEVDLLHWMKSYGIVTEEERKSYEKRVKTAHPEFFE